MINCIIYSLIYSLNNPPDFSNAIDNEDFNLLSAIHSILVMTMLCSYENVSVIFSQ